MLSRLHCVALMSLTALVGCAKKTEPEQAPAATALPAVQSAPGPAVAPTAAAPPATAKAERGTPTEAEAMLKSAMEHYKAVGRTQALADFNAKKAPFGDRDLYVACIGPDHKLSANGGFPRYVGASPDVLRDAEGKPVAKAILDAAKSTDSGGSVRYRWMNPLTGKNEGKLSFARKFGDDVCVVGAYTPD